MMDRRLKKEQLIYWLIILGLFFSQSFQLYYSAMPSFSLFFNMGPIMICLNTLVIAAVNLMLVFVFREWSRTLLFTSILFSIWSVANYYVIEYHGSPIFFSEFGSLGAALAVAGSYKYKITKAVVGLSLVFVVEIIMIFMIGQTKIEKYDRQKSTIHRIVFLIVDLVFLYVGLYSPASVKPALSMRWSWADGVEKYGYVCCVIEDLSRFRTLYNTPANYNVAKIQIAEEESEEFETDELPDLIMIVNETFCDLEFYSTIKTNEYMKQFYSIDNSISGWAVVPNIGGGTNDTEYELLTSNSMYLLSVTAPFNYYKLRNPRNNALSYLRTMGYHSWGMHCSLKTNYSRHIAYPAFGFDSVLLGADDFQKFNSYGNRLWLDDDNYGDLISHYENAGNDPQFMYLLTFQNHGGWEQNEPEFDSIHTDIDLGDLTDDVDEYMTSIKMSVDAFIHLKEYYSKKDRHVIICMVGDHAPSFIDNLPANRQMTWEEEEISKRVVPYIIWANFDARFPDYTEYVSITDLMPMVFDIAGLPLTPFYNYILNLHDHVPVRTANGIYMDAFGQVGIYDESSEYYDMLTQYYYMEYNALSGGEEYRKDLFELQ